MEHVKKMLKLFKENIRNYEVRLDFALGQMYEERTPLRVVDYALYQEMDDEVFEYCKVHGLNYEDYDVEEMIFSE